MIRGNAWDIGGLETNSEVILFGTPDITNGKGIRNGER